MDAEDDAVAASAVAEDEKSLERYYVSFGAAFVRGRLGLAVSDDEQAFRTGLDRGLKLHKFKRLDGRVLARVRRVLSLLAALAPTSLLDVGSGRGAFLWPLLDAFPHLPVTAIDMDERRASDLDAISRGGLEQLSARQMDATNLDFADDTFDAVTLLEVLEHMTEPAKAARAALRVAKRFVVASVPSKPDDNPEHIQLFNPQTLTALFAGARRVTIEHVPGHMIALAHVAP